jgi:hypothetical protein
MSTAFPAVHVERSKSFVVELPVDRAFPLFEPEGERAWAKGWDPEYLHPRATTKAERGMVFRTRHGAEETLWTVVRHDPADAIVEYVRVTPGSRMGRVLVQCARMDAMRTRVTVIYALTGLSEAGNAALREFDAAYDAFIDSWAAAIRSATTT